VESKLRLLLRPGRLPAEYADVERLSSRIALAALVVFGFILLSGHHYVAYVASVIAAVVVGRAIGFAFHNRENRTPRNPGIARSRVPFSVLLALISFVALVPALYWTRATGRPVFVLESLIAVATLYYAIGRLVAGVAFGCVEVGLIVLSLALCLRSPDPAFLIAAAYSALMAWALLFKKGARTPASPAGTSQSPDSARSIVSARNDS